MSSKSFVLVSIPVGIPTHENFRIEERPIPKPSDGEVLAKTLFISVDPYLRLLIGGAFPGSFGVGDVFVGHHVAQVVESKHAQFPVGSVIAGVGPFSEYFTTKGEGYRVVDEKILPLSVHIGALGMPGLSAYFGFLDVTKPKAGETVVVSGAAGAVGSVVGQIAKNLGLRVIGIAGSDDKVKHLEKLGFDAGINYNKTPNLLEALKGAAPKGVDIYFDNVGGEISDAVYRLLNVHGRVSVCGQISSYNDTEEPKGPRFGKDINLKRLRIQGFMVNEYRPQFPEGYHALTAWYKEGKLKADETVFDGFDKITDAFIGLFTGKNTGKAIIKIADVHK
eukprot:TRINITY_DN7000_c0_g1_i1.p1 TRINITY_DN7000_c0_g1~~TRINITY_DN7000_c0_g1_i1.p1  ORF type:complete len:335 (-),score=71.35 TRINITY_DN7000_c0_g1_i1:76-1080(-)